MEDRLDQLLKLKPTRSDGIASYNAFLEAADQEIVKSGIETVQISQIIQASGVSGRSLYNYFPDGLFDLVVVLHYYRQRRVKHTMRTGISQALIGYHISKISGESLFPFPIFMAVYLIVHSIFRSLREKPELDRQLAYYLGCRHYTTKTMQDRIILDEIVYALRTMSDDSITDDCCNRFATVIFYGAKGVIDGCLTHQFDEVITREFEHSMVTMFTHYMAAEIGELKGEMCGGCKAMHTVKVREMLPLLPLLKSERRQEPVTSTIPIDPLTLCEEVIKAVIQEAIDLENDAGGEGEIKD